MVLADVSLEDLGVGPSEAQAVMPEDVCLSSISVHDLDVITVRDQENARLREQVAVLTQTVYQLRRESGSSVATVQDRYHEETQEQTAEP